MSEGPKEVRFLSLFLRRDVMIDFRKNFNDNWPWHSVEAKCDFLSNKLTQCSQSAGFRTNLGGNFCRPGWDSESGYFCTCLGLSCMQSRCVVLVLGKLDSFVEFSWTLNVGISMLSEFCALLMSFKWAQISVDSRVRGVCLQSDGGNWPRRKKQDWAQ